MNILHIISSPRKEASASIQLANGIIEKLQAAHPGSNVTVHDLASHPFPHLEEAKLQSFFTPAESRTPEQQAAAKHSDDAIQEIKDADVIVIGAPLYNFGIPSTLKAWVDHIARAGITFRYTATGPEGLITGKKVYVAMSSGGIYSEDGRDRSARRRPRPARPASYCRAERPRQRDHHRVGGRNALPVSLLH
jgi:FMN-dependent NADH-azoreductase